MAVPELSLQGSSWSSGLAPTEAERFGRSHSPAPGETQLYPLIPVYYLSRMPMAGAKCSVGHLLGHSLGAGMLSLPVSVGTSNLGCVRKGST